jgi:hypothetical protein
MLSKAPDVPWFISASKRAYSLPSVDANSTRTLTVSGINPELPFLFIKEKANLN